VTGTFSNPALAAHPSEIKRGCSFADDFVTLTMIAENSGTDTGTGNVANRGLTTTNYSHIIYDIVSQPSGFSVKIRFKKLPLLTLDSADWSGGNGATISNTDDGNIRVNNSGIWGDARKTILKPLQTYRSIVSVRGDGVSNAKIYSNNTLLSQTTNSEFTEFVDDFTAGGLDSIYRIAKDPGGEWVEFQLPILKPTAVLIGNADLIAGGAADGFTVWVDGDGVKANHSDGVSIPTQCAVDIDYEDSAVHTVTYVVDMVGGTHKLYVDALEVDSQTTTISTEIGTTNPIVAGGNGVDNFFGELYEPRIFDALLTESEHDVYHAGTLKSGFWSPTASWRCDTVTDDTAAGGNKLWDRTVSQNDLYKADRLTSSKFPTLTTDSLGQQYYTFDGVDDYISQLTELVATLTTYTLTAATSSAGSPYPVVQQHNDDTFWADLEIEGGYTGYLHGMILHNGVLSTLQLYFDEYQHLYWIWRGRAFGAYHRLITMGNCQLAVFFDYAAAHLQDYSKNLILGAATSITQQGTDGSEWTAASSTVRFADEANLRFPSGTIFVHIKESTLAVCTLVDKGTNYKFSLVDVAGDLTLDFNGSQASLAAGLELITNGDFATDVSGWTDRSTFEGGGSGDVIWNAAGKAEFKFTYV
jgi:hypothetical protein